MRDVSDGVYNGGMTTTTTHRANLYDGDCSHCGERVPAHSGYAYRRPNVRHWFVRCGDEQTCAQRVTDRQKQVQDEWLQRHMNSDDHRTAIALAAQYDLPKTVTYTHNDCTITYARRLTSSGCNVTETTTCGDRVNKLRNQFYTEVDAIGYVIRQLEIASRPFLGEPRPEAAAVLDAARVVTPV